MKPVVYVETTIPSYYFDQRPEIQFEIGRTKEWWDEERFDYELISSEAVLEELEDPQNPNREQCLALLENVPIVRTSLEVVRVAEAFIARGLMPRTRGLDAMHLAFACCYRADFLLTWNCRHLANPNKFAAIRQVGTAMGLFIPTLTTPYELRQLREEE